MKSFDVKISFLLLLLMLLSAGGDGKAAVSAGNMEVPGASNGETAGGEMHPRLSRSGSVPLLSERGLPFPDESDGGELELAPAGGRLIHDPFDGRILFLHATVDAPVTVKWRGGNNGTGSLRAETVAYFLDTREVIAEGDVLLLQDGAYFSCNLLYLDMKKKRGLATDVVLSGSIGLLNYFRGLDTPDIEVFHRGESRLEMPEIQPREKMRAGAARAEAKEILRTGKASALIRDLRLTMSSMAEPAAEVSFREAEYRFPGGEGVSETAGMPAGSLSARHMVVWLWGVPVFYFPKITYSSKLPRLYLRLRYGSSEKFGNMVFARAGWRKPASGGDTSLPVEFSGIYFDADLRSSRGPALGVDFRYKLPRWNGGGRVWAYAVREDRMGVSEDLDRSARDADRLNLIGETGLPSPRVSGTPFVLNDEYLLAAARRARDGVLAPNSIPEVHRGETRGWVGVRQRMALSGSPNRPIGSRTLLDLAAARLSDRDVLHEYSEDAYHDGGQAMSFGILRHVREDFQLSLLASRRTISSLSVAPADPYADRWVEYRPEVSAFLPPEPLRWGILAEAEIGGGEVGWVYHDYVPSGQRKRTDRRLFGSAVLRRPFRFGPVIFSPYAGGKAVAYDGGDYGGDMEQAAPVWGMSAVTRIYGRFPHFKSRLFGFESLRHIVEFGARYEAVGATRINPLELPGYDEWDDLKRVESFLLEIDQRFMTGRGAQRDWLGLRLSTRAYPRSEDRERLLQDRVFESVAGNISWNPSRNVSFGMGCRLSPENGRIEQLHWGASWRVSAHLRARLYHYYEQSSAERGVDGLSQLFGAVKFPLTRHWGAAFEGVYDFFDTERTSEGFNRQRITLTRIFNGLDLSFFIERSRGSDDVLGMVNLRIYPAMRNLRVLSDICPVPPGALPPVSAKKAPPPEGSTDRR